MNKQLIFAAGAVTGLIVANVATKTVIATGGAVAPAMFLGASALLRPLGVAAPAEPPWPSHRKDHQY